MTTEERIADLERWADVCLQGADRELEAVVYEIRALRLMLREEIREAAWRLAGDSAVAKFHHLPYDQDDPIASRKAPPPADASNHTT